MVTQRKMSLSFTIVNFPVAQFQRYVDICVAGFMVYLPTITSRYLTWTERVKHESQVDDAAQPRMANASINYLSHIVL